MCARERKGSERVCAWIINPPSTACTSSLDWRMIASRVYTRSRSQQCHSSQHSPKTKGRLLGPWKSRVKVVCFCVLHSSIATWTLYSAIFSPKTSGRLFLISCTIRVILLLCEVIYDGRKMSYKMIIFSFEYYVLNIPRNSMLLRLLLRFINKFVN